MSVPSTDDLLAFARFVAQRSPHAFKVFNATTEEDFIDGVERALLAAVTSLEGGRAEYAGLGELALSKKLADELRAGSIPAAAEEYENGHVDIKIRHSGGLHFLYIGECKIWQSVPYHQKGMSQVLNDYSSGRHRRGCCLEFVYRKDAAGKLKMIREHLDKHKPLGQQGDAVNHGFLRGGFITTHSHDSGWDVEVTHFAANLHNPKAKPKP